MSTSDNQRAGYLAIGASVLGLAAVIGVVFAGRWGDEATSVPDAVEPAASRGLESPAGSTRALVRAPDAGRADAGVGALGLAAGSAGTESGTEALPGSVGTLATSSASGGTTEVSSPGETTGSEPGPETPRPSLALTPEQAYEAHAFLEDLVTLRIDSLRREIADAPRIGDGRSLRRLEPALTVLEEESTRLAARRRELERNLPSPPEPDTEAGDGTSEATDPAPGE